MGHAAFRGDASVDSGAFWQYHEQFALNRARHAKKDGATTALRCNVPRSLTQTGGRIGNAALLDFKMNAASDGLSLQEMVTYLEKRLEEQGQVVMEIRAELASRARLVSSMYRTGHALISGAS